MALQIDDAAVQTVMVTKTKDSVVAERWKYKLYFEIKEYCGLLNKTTIFWNSKIWTFIKIILKHWAAGNLFFF